MLASESLGYSFVKAGLPSRSAFVKDMGEQLSTFVLIHWHRYMDKFAVEIAWICKTDLDSIFSMYDPEAALGLDAAIVPVHSIVGQSETWWVIPAVKQSPGPIEGQKDITPLIRQAFDFLNTHGLPYLDRIVSLKRETNNLP